MNISRGRWALAAGTLSILWACGGQGEAGTGTSSESLAPTERTEEVSVEAADGGCTKLKVLNYKNWCKVSVNGGTYSKAAERTVCVDPGTVDLALKAASTEFEIGPAPWHDTAGDTGDGDPGTLNGKIDSTTVVVKHKAACVWACCPFVGGGGCPTTDQCL